MAKKNWEETAVKKPGSFRATVKRDGLMKGNGPIPMSAVKKEEKSKNPTTRKRAFLAETFKKQK